jgi:hypothetical protein
MTRKQRMVLGVVLSIIGTILMAACSFSRETKKSANDELHATAATEVTKHEAPREVVTYHFRAPSGSVTPGIGRQVWCGARCGKEAPQLADVESVTVERIGAVDTTAKTAAQVDATAHEDERSKTKAAISPWKIAAVVIALLAVLAVSAHFALKHYLAV